MLSMIAAISRNNCIGKNGKLPWNIKEDMEHFKQLTVGKTVIMGRKTWESIPEKFRPLPNRTNIVVTRQSGHYPLPVGVLRSESLTKILQNPHLYSIQSNSETLIIGGGELYKEGINLADRLYITHIHKTIDGDTFFPNIDPTIWKERERQDYPEFTFSTYERL